MLPARKVIVARRLLLSTSKLFLTVFFIVLAAPQLRTPTVHANDGTGLDKITWSGTIRIERESHSTTDQRASWNETVTGKSEWRARRLAGRIE